MKTFAELPEKERELLLQFPVYISLLAANSDQLMDEPEKETAVWLTHIKTFSTEPDVQPFYKEAELVFEKNLSLIDRKISDRREERETEIKAALRKIDLILQQMNIDFANALRRSMRSYKDYISKAHQNVLEYFIFPVPIDGISA
ncbi:MAG: hypothetical protein V4450_06285 [Bacteroidota bacterium]